MRVAYFTNQYPAPSHTFIRREIHALEKLGVTVLRYAIRPSVTPLVDNRDLQETQNTRYILSTGAFAALGYFFWAAVTRPTKLLKVLSLALQLGWRSDRGLLKNLAYAAESCILASWTRRDRIDHVHAHFGTNPAFIAMLASGFSGIPFSFTVHGSEEFDKAPLLSLDEKLGHAAFAVCVSSYGRSQLMRATRTDQWSKIKVVHCGLDDYFLDGPSSEPSPDRRLLCVGRICEQKAQLLIVEAAELLLQRGIDFTIVLAGDGPMRPTVEAAISQAGLANRISITGWISNEQVKAELLASRALILPSFAEGLPVVIMEAMALGRPVISTYIAGIPELVQPGKTGWLVPASDVKALAEAMKEALEAPMEQLSAMGDAGRIRVRHRHNVMAEATKLKTLFEGVQKI